MCRNYTGPALTNGSCMHAYDASGHRTLLISAQVKRYHFTICTASRVQWLYFWVTCELSSEALLNWLGRYQASSANLLLWLEHGRIVDSALQRDQMHDSCQNRIISWRSSTRQWQQRLWSIDAGYRSGYNYLPTSIIMHSTRSCSLLKTAHPFSIQNQSIQNADSLCCSVVCIELHRCSSTSKKRSQLFRTILQTFQHHFQLFVLVRPSRSIWLRCGLRSIYGRSFLLPHLP